MRIKLTCALLSVLSFSALAQTGGFVGTEASGAATRGGFDGPAAALTSVARVKALPDNAWVALEGRIVKQVGHEHYEFNDGSGTINVDVDDKYWHGLTVKPTDKVRIEGEVDKDWNSVKIDVKSVRLVN